MSIAGRSAQRVDGHRSAAPSISRLGRRHRPPARVTFSQMLPKSRDGEGAVAGDAGAGGDRGDVEASDRRRRRCSRQGPRPAPVAGCISISEAALLHRDRRRQLAREERDGAAGAAARRGAGASARSRRGPPTPRSSAARWRPTAASRWPTPRCALMRARSSDGMAIAAMMPMIATTISSSIRVNPCAACASSWSLPSSQCRRPGCMPGTPASRATPIPGAVGRGGRRSQRVDAQRA